MKKTNTIACGLALCLLLALPACTQNEEQPGTKEEAENIRIGFSMATLLEDRWLRDRDIFISKAQQMDIEVIIKNSNRDSDIQYQQVLELLEQGIDVLVIAPNDADKEARCVEVAQKQGVPVVVYDRLIRHANADVYIAFDGHMVGRLMANYLLEQAPEGSYLLVNGPKTDNNSIMIWEGYMQVLQPYIDSGAITIAAETWTEGWVRENAYNFVKETISRQPEDLVAAICQNDSLAWGVADAFSEANIRNILIVGMDADLSACQRIVNGRQAMTVYKPIPDLVAETLEACVTLANGQALQTNRTISTGSREIPYIAIDVHPVTAGNMVDTVVKDGFHLEEDIYI